MKTKIITLGILTIIGIGSYTYAMSPEERKQLEMERIARQKAKQAQQAPQPTVPEQSQVSTTSSSPIAGLGEEKYKKHLNTEYEKACQEGNVDWLIANKKVLIDKHIVGKQEFDFLLSTLELPKRESELTKKRRKQDLDIQREVCLNLMKRATSEQKAIEALAPLYMALAAKEGNASVLTGNDEISVALKELAQIKDLSRFYTRLNELALDPRIIATIGNEMHMLRGHMLYRIWENPQLLAEQPDRTLKIFNEVSQKRDINAMINIYRDFLKNKHLPYKKQLST